MPTIEDPVVVNPDRFVRELKTWGRGRPRKAKPTKEDYARRIKLKMCDACILNKHRECLGECPCIHWQLAIV